MAAPVLEEFVGYRARVDEALVEYLQGETPTRLYEAARHLPESGGKRLRPILVLLGYDAVDGGDIEAALPAAVAVELIHTCSLSHDDIIDEDTLRRGTESVHARWDVPTGILAGDLLYATAFEAMVDSAAPAETIERCCRVLAETCSVVCEGQFLDTEFESREDVTEADYMEMVERKTGALLGASLQIGALLGGAERGVARGLRGFGTKIGTAFQIHDDVLDVVQSSTTLGKEQGSDVAAGKETLLTVHAREQGVDLSGPTEAVRERLADAGSVDYARERAQTLVAEATEQLPDLPDAEVDRTLRELAEFLVSREY
jgi:geranylgeranyl diphosphate synthase type I